MIKRQTKFLGITPGSKKPAEDIAGVFDKIAKSGKPSEIKPDESYEKEIEHRWGKIKSIEEVI